MKTVSLPIGADLKPIDVDDTICWDGDTTPFTVAWMAYYGKDRKGNPIWVLYDEEDEEGADNTDGALHVPDKTYGELIASLGDAIDTIDSEKSQKMINEIVPQLVAKYRREHPKEMI